MTKPDINLNNISSAANNAAQAAKSASDAASAAASNAAIAAKAAAESATAIAVVATDTTWMKKSLSGIENTLEEMRNQYVTMSQHAEVVKILDSHEKAIEDLQTEKTRTAVLLSIGIGILSLLVTLLVYHLLGKG
jgi:exo-beta-1,3-glucanase (GH17 family)